MNNEASHRRRRSQVAELIRQKRFVTLSQLSQQFDVSESTARRDLEHLEQQGVAARTHGGAYFVQSQQDWSDWAGTSAKNAQAKLAIASVAARLIADSEPIILDGGSTTLEVARHLVGRDIHIMTNSLPIANLLGADPRSDLIFIGGNVCARSGVTRGPLTDAMIRSVRVRKAVLGVASVHEDGLYNDNMLLVETERAMIAAADEMIVVADSTKFGLRSISHLCSLDKVGMFVVDDGIAPEWRDRLQQAGIEVIIAETTSADVEPTESISYPNETDMAGDDIR